jgi:hypothetical protein
MMSARLEIRDPGPVGFLHQLNSSSRPFIAFLEADDLNLDARLVIQVTMRGESLAKFGASASRKPELRDWDV